MGQHLFKAATLVLAAAAALSSMSASAGDYHDGYRPFQHHGPFPLHPPRVGAYATEVAFSTGYRHGYRPFHHRGPVRLQQISWPQHYTQPQPTRIILMDRQYAADIGTYAGTADMYQADDGTYIVGYGGGYDQYQGEPAALKPRAKIINVKRAGNACSYEAGVCVIRP
ncbi:hypothetical protein ACXHXG_18745 [Rhizobium sp. LEGMi198b]